MTSLRIFVASGLIALLTALTGKSQSNLVLFVSSSGDYIGQGSTYATAVPTNFSFSGSSSRINAGAFGYGFTFVAPSGTSLAVGTYSNATRYPFQGTNAGIDISGNGRGCNNECGMFTINEIHTNASGAVDRLWLTFSNSCECFMAAMTGEIRYQSLLAPNPGAQTFLVPSQYSTIQAAINAATYSGPTTIFVAPGTYNEAITFAGKPLSLIGVSGMSKTILQVPAANNGVLFTSTETSNSVISGFTITGAASGYAAINCSGSTPTIISNALVNCPTGMNVGSGAAPYVIGNTMANLGGSSINASGSGTAGYFQGNLIQNNAGGIFTGYGASPTFINNIIVHNSGDVFNGFNGSAVNIIQNIIAFNTGSAVNYLVPSGDRGPVCINNTIVSNTAGFSISGYDGSSELINNIVIGPSALNISYFNSPTTPITWNNDFYNAGGSPYSGVVSNLAGVNGNVSVEPLFTCGVSGDFRLLPTSPVINAGSNGAPYLTNSDLAGAARVISGTIDMGAFEADPAAPINPCMYVNCPSNIVATTLAGQTNVVVTFPPPTGTPGATLTSFPASGSVFPTGTNTVTCIATYGTNTASCSFTIVVMNPPKILGTLFATNVPAGQSFTLPVSPGGSGPFTYQWYFENTVIPGATNNPVTINNAQEANEGLYSVTIYNLTGSTNGPVASVRVIPSLPNILINPASLILSATSNATFQVTATGSQPLGYQWLFNGGVIGGAKSAQLTITNAQAVSAGNYQVVVSNGLGAVTSAVASLTVTARAPFFTSQPASLTQIAGGANLSLSGSANGSQPIFYQWQFNGGPIIGATNAIFLLTNAAPSNSGIYTLVASSFAGTNSSTSAQVIIYQKPAITILLTNQVVDVGNNVVLAANVIGTPPLSYSWQFNGQPMTGSNSTLNITNIQIQQSGFYNLSVANLYGTTTTVARISVLGRPGSLIAWGDNSGGQTNIPASLGAVVMMSGGDYHSAGLTHAGTISAWGYNGDGQCSIPTNALRFVNIASGAAHNLAVTDSGSVLAWGRNDAGQCNVPSSLSNATVAVAAGDSHSLALLNNGTVIGWGDNSFGQISIPQSIGLIRAIAAGREHSLALRTNGTVAAWGYNAYGQTNVPATLSNVLAITAGYLHSVALLSNGTVICWGNNSFGQCNVPAGLTNATAIAAGDFHTIALRTDGTITTWGSDSLGQLDAPPLAHVGNIASGNYHSLASILLPGPLALSLTNSQMVVQWTGQGILQSSTNPSGPFSDVLGFQGTSYTNSTKSNTSKFFRLRQ